MGLFLMSNTVRDWYPHFPAEFLTDRRVERMSLEQEGAYRRLLDYAWRERGLPNDPALLAHLLRISRRRFEQRIWPAIADCWVERRGKLVNPRQEKERKKAKRIKKERRAAAMQRWAQPKAKARVKPPAKAKQKQSKRNALLPIPYIPPLTPPTPENANASEGEPRELPNGLSRLYDCESCHQEKPAVQMASTDPPRCVSCSLRAQAASP